MLLEELIGKEHIKSTKFCEMHSEKFIAKITMDQEIDSLLITTLIS